MATGAPAAVSSGAAMLNGIVSSNGAASTVRFKYGLTAGCGSGVTATQSPRASGKPASAAIGGLISSTLYHFPCHRYEQRRPGERRRRDLYERTLRRYVHARRRIAR